MALGERPPGLIEELRLPARAIVAVLFFRVRGIRLARIAGVESDRPRDGLMRAAMTYAANFDLPMIHHTADHSLVGDGVMNESALASISGLKGIPVEELAAQTTENFLRLFNRMPAPAS